ncbi:MAG: RNase stability modulator [Paenibacillaceae bacterium]|jgi:diguanylate cyclase (GGDEF)-like protein|nr:RNase stability modulator [Paenibacillaceae bacterium]
MISLTGRPELAQRLKQQLLDGSAGIIYVDTVEYAGLELSMGRAFCDRIVGITGQVLQDLLLSRTDVIGVESLGDDWIVFAGFGQQDPVLGRSRLKELTCLVKRRLEEGLQEAGGSTSLSAYAGCCLLAGGNGGSAAQLEQMIYSAVKRSIRSIHLPATLEEDLSKREEFLSIISTHNITSVYQPIVSLRDASVFGFEALTRGPRDSEFQSPLALFGYAEAHGELYALDRLAREKAIEGCHSLQKEQRVFINIPAQVINDPQFAPGITLQALKRCGISPHNVVLELTERSSIEDFATAKRILQHYRNQGYQIAIDDAGAGYSSLQAIAELKPDFIKVDRSLIMNIHQDKMKEMILETFVSFARKMSIRIIAEGIESWEELKKLSQMGVHYGQGFLLGRPAPGLQPLQDDIAAHVERINRIQGLDSFLQIGNLATVVESFDVSTPISVISQYFNHHEDIPGTVIVHGQQPVGLVMRERLFQQLAGQYGISLYWNRPIEQLMDRSPLVVEQSVPIESVSQMAMAREKNQLYDLVIITSRDKMMGVASIRTILDAITNLRMETARVANPLTGLPGNTQINREMKKWIFDARAFSVIYADLDYFKWYNDRFGFQKGDQLIQFTADVLQQSIAACGHPHDFVGHIGGDDFIAITAASDADRVCEEMIRRFRQGVTLFCEGEDWGTVLDRSGKPVASEGVHISLSLVVCQCTGRITPEGISQAAAVLKKQAKAQNGSVYMKALLEEPPSAYYVSNSDKSSSIL